jgi:hypothetical protein
VINSDVTARDRDMERGADVVLHRLLLDLVSDENGQLADGIPSTFTFRQRQKIGIICKSIEMMYQCSKKQVEKSFQRIGMDLLDVFSVILSTELRIHNSYHARAMNADAQQLSDLPHSYLKDGGRRDTTIKSLTRAICSFARVKSATTAMAVHGHLISLLEAIVECSKGTISFESQHNALWILANVACDKTNASFILSTNKRLIHTLTRAASDPANIVEQNSLSTSRSRCYQAVQVQRTALRCILNLSFLEKAVDQIISRGDFLSAVCRILTVPTEPFRNSERVHEVIVQIKHYSTGIMHNLSNTSDRNKEVLYGFEQGSVMISLRDAANNGDAVVQRKANQTLANLICFNRVHVASLK